MIMTANRILNLDAHGVDKNVPLCMQERKCIRISKWCSLCAKEDKSPTQPP